MSDPTRCPQCGAISAGAGPRGLCPACLLGLAFAADPEIDADDEEELRAPVCRVLSVLSAEDDRTTYLAEEAGTRRLVTLDVVKLPRDGIGEVLSSCRERLRALMRWSHPGAPRVVGGRLSPAGDFCVVAHYVQGQRLDRFCEVQKLDAAARRRLFDAVCDTIASGQAGGVSHGRLRPDLVVASGSSHDPRPVVLGYSVTPGRSPAAEDDAAGLENLARGLRIAN